MNLYILLVMVLLNEGAIALHVLARFQRVSRHFLLSRLVVMAATLGALSRFEEGGLELGVLATLSLGGFIYATVLPILLVSRFFYLVGQVRYREALRLLGVARWVPTLYELPPAEELHKLEILRRGDPTALVGLLVQRRNEALATGDAGAAALLGAELIQDLVLARRWSDAVVAHETFFGGQLTELAPMTVAMLARAYGALGNLPAMTAAVSHLEHGTDSARDIMSLNMARVVYLAYQGAAEEIDSLLSSTSGLLREAPRYLRPYYRGIAHHRAGDHVGAAGLFAIAIVEAPEEERPTLREAIASFNDHYRDLPPARPAAPEVAFIGTLGDRLRPYAAVPRAGLALRDLPVTWALSVLNLGLWIAMELRGDTTSSAFLIDCGALYGPAISAGEWWRLLAPICLHAGLLHLAFNTLGLLYLGRVCERLYGSAAFLLVYAAAGVCGTLASWVGNVGVSVGASGAIYGVLGGLIALLLKGRMRFPLAWRARYLNLMLVLAAINLILGFQIEQVDNAAHLGGLVGGLLIGSLLARRRLGERRSRAAQVVMAVGLTALLIGAVAVIFKTATTSRQETIARLPAQTITTDELMLIDLPGSWLHRREYHSFLVFDPFSENLAQFGYQLGEGPGFGEPRPRSVGRIEGHWRGVRYVLEHDGRQLELVHAVIPTGTPGRLLRVRVVSEDREFLHILQRAVIAR